MSILPCEHMFFNKISTLSERNDGFRFKKAEGEWLAVGRVRKLSEFSTLSMDRQREAPSWSEASSWLPKNKTALPNTTWECCYDYRLLLI